jgi:hypothetical protein
LVFFPTWHIFSPNLTNIPTWHRSCHRGAASPSHAREGLLSFQGEDLVSFPHARPRDLLPSRDFFSFSITVLRPLVHGKPHHQRRLGTPADRLGE